jgi:hypothetical protein
VGEIEYLRGQWQQHDLSHFKALGEATRAQAARALYALAFTNVQRTQDAMPGACVEREAILLDGYCCEQNESALSAESIEALYDSIADSDGRHKPTWRDFNYWASISQNNEIHPLIKACYLHCSLIKSTVLSMPERTQLAFLLQHRVLNRWEPRFVAVPITEYILELLYEYRQTVSPVGRLSDAILFILDGIKKAMDSVLEAIARSQTASVGEGAEDICSQTEVVRWSTNERKLLELFKDAESQDMTLAKAAKQLGISGSTAERMSRRLQEGGMLERVGSKRGGYWHVKE